LTQGDLQPPILLIPTRNDEIIAFHAIICQYFKGKKGLAPLSTIPFSQSSKPNIPSFQLRSEEDGNFHREFPEGI
jgi:hypothetical protein